MPDLEGKMREKDVVVSKTNTPDPRQACVTADCGFCGAVYVVLCRFRVGRLVLGGVLGTLHHGDSHFNHLRKSSVAAVPETIVLDCSLIFNICNSSETLSKLLLFLAFFNEKDKNGSDWAFLWSLWQHSRCFAAELLTG